MIISAIKQQVKRADRYSIFVDGKYAFSLSESGLLEQRLATGQALDPTQLRRLKEAAGLDKAYGQALRFTAMRPRSEGELHDYFRRKAIDPAAAAEIMPRLQRIGLLDDLAFARSWVANRRLLKSVSKRRLILELKQKRVSEEIIQQVLAEDTVDERQALRQLIDKKRSRYADDRKLMQYLARQGFSFDDIKSVLHETED